MQIVVLGMHRSGTSALCGLLNLAGVYFGREGEFIQTKDENPKGFWERKDVRRLNDEILHSLGSDWSEISTLEQEKLSGKVLEKVANHLPAPWLARVKSEWKENDG